MLFHGSKVYLLLDGPKPDFLFGTLPSGNDTNSPETPRFRTSAITGVSFICVFFEEKSAHPNFSCKGFFQMHAKMMIFFRL